MTEQPAYGDKRLEDNFWRYVTVNAITGCWVWTGSRTTRNYGQVTRRVDGVGKKYGAHRYAYERLIEPLPSELHLDHLCLVTFCCNPSHLEPVSPAENSRRRAELRKACPEGHPYDGDNLYVDPSESRKCRTCVYEKARARKDRMGEEYLRKDREAARAYRARKKAEAA